MHSYLYQNIILLSPSEEAEIGSGGDQPVRNILTEGNGKRESLYLPPFFLFHSLMPKKTHCFVRSKKRPNMLQKNKLKNQLLTRKKVNVFQDRCAAVQIRV